MNKIAIPTRNEIVDAHFGQCEYYTIYTIDENNSIIAKEDFTAPEGCGCKSNVASVLANKGVGVMLAGNMGAGAMNVISASGIRVIRGCSGEVKTIVNNYLKGNLKDDGLSCDHHDHQCNH